MNWGRSFRVREYLRGSLWVLPLVGGVLGSLLGVGVFQLDKSVDVPTFLQYSPSTASTILATIVGAMAGVTGFVVTVTVLVVQMATGTFSARYMRLWYRDLMLKTLLALLIGTITFSFTLLRRVGGDTVPDIGVTVAGFLVFINLLVFVIFLDRYLHRLRPVSVAAIVGRAGRDTFDAAVRAAAAPDAPDVLPSLGERPGEPTLLVRSETAGALQAIDGRGLVQWARKHDCLLVLPHTVGDFVPAEAPLIEVYGGHADGGSAARSLRGMIALGEERTLQQDPAFAIRVMVDIACRALSAAVNDPTTGVQVLDHLAEILRAIGTTDLQAPSTRVVEDRRQWVLMPARRFEDYLALGVTEIREYGATTIQVNRRLRALLEELREEVLPKYRAAVDDELARLDASVKIHFANSPDLDRASTADRQGIGGPVER